MNSNNKKILAKNTPIQGFLVCLVRPDCFLKALYMLNPPQIYRSYKRRCKKSLHWEYIILYYIIERLVYR